MVPANPHQLPLRPANCTRMLALLICTPALRPGRLTLSKTKQLLSRFDVPATSVFEADELRALLRSELPGVAEATGHAVPLEYVAAAADALGPGATVDSKLYCAVRLELPEVGSPQAASSVRFVLDTAASNSLVTPEASAALGARSTGVTASASTATSSDAGGFQQVSLGEARLPGGLSLGPLAPVVMPLPLPGRAGLLGLDVLARFAIELVLRSSRPFAVLHPPGALPAEARAGLRRLPTRRLPGSGLLVTRVALGPEGEPPRAELDAVIDLGSSLTIVSPGALAAAGRRSLG